MSALADALEALVTDLPHRDARAILRISSAIGPRVDGVDYWRARGRARFARELADDGVPTDLIERALVTVDEVLGSRVIPDDISLDAILEDLRRRSTGVSEGGV
jgi:hypothetical protein